MPFKKYRKIHSLEKEETKGILFGKCYVMEKIDGANTSIWMEDGEMKFGTRNQLITGGFNGFCDYIREHEGVKQLLTDFPHYRLYGEWLVHHSCHYRPTAYKQWYMFDIEDMNELNERPHTITNEDGSKDLTTIETTKYINLETVYSLAEKYNINTPHLFGIFENPTATELIEITGKSVLTDDSKGEGIVIKNFNFVNKFGDRDYAKIVTPEHKENNTIVFGDNNKYSDSYWEIYVTNKCITLERVRKIMQKIQPLEEKPLGLEHTPRIVSTVLHDFITEESWWMFNKVLSINFKELKRIASKKVVQIYHDILRDTLSVADNK